MKVYCKNCRHCIKFSDGDSAKCSAVKQYPTFDKYTNRFIGRTETVSLDENKEGTCIHYYPNARTRVKAFLRRRFK